MAHYRLRQQESRIKLAVSNILRDGLKDPRIGFISVTGVELSRDISYCTIYVSVFGSDDDKSSTMEALESARGYLRRELTRRVDLRKSPEIIFKLDESMEKGAKINSILRELEGEQDDN